MVARARSRPFCGDVSGGLPVSVPNILRFRSRFGGCLERGAHFHPPGGPDFEDVSIGLLVLVARLVGADSSQDATGGSNRLQEAPGDHMRSQEASGGHRKTQEATGCPKRLQEAPGSSRRPQETTGGPRRQQEAPGGLGRQQEAPRGPRSRRPQKATGVAPIPCVLRMLLSIGPHLEHDSLMFYVCFYRWSFSCVHNPKCFTHVPMYWASPGARVLGVLRVFL